MACLSFSFIESYPPRRRDWGDCEGTTIGALSLGRDGPSLWAGRSSYFRLAIDSGPSFSAADERALWPLVQRSNDGGTRGGEALVGRIGVGCTEVV